MRTAATIPSVMRAVIANGFGGPEVLSVKADVPVPEVKSPDEVLIKVQATAINRADTMQRKGNYPPPPGASSILGLECAGTIVKAGGPFKEGDKVMALLGGGGYAEYCVAHSNQCMPIPQNCPSLMHAAAVPETLLTAYQCLRIAGMKEKVAQSKNVLIHAGASGVGTALCQLTRVLGGEPVITASAEKLNDPIIQQVCPKWRFQRANAAAPAAPAQVAEQQQQQQQQQQRPATPPAPLPQWVADIEAAMGKNAIHAVIDPVVGTGYLQGDLELLAMDSTIIILAMMGGATLPKFNVATLFRKRATVQGSTLRSRSDTYKGELVADFMKNVYPSLWAARDGCAPVEPIISKTLALDDIVAAHKMIDNNEVIGKIVIKVSEN